MRKRYVTIAAMAAASLALAACSSSGSSSGGGGGGGSTSPVAGSSSAGSGGGQSDGSTIKIGFLNDSTGPNSSAYVTTTKGIDAALKPINAAGGINGHKIEYIEGDTTSTPAGALTAAQKLVQQNHVFAIIENSGVFYGAEPWLLQHNIPVIGSAVDGPIWTDPKNTNLYESGGWTGSGYGQAQTGQYAKSVGATKCGAIGYGVSQSSSDAAKAFVQSCKMAGLKEGYLDSTLQFGSTDVGPMALAIKNSGTDAVYLPIDPSTAFALAAALKQLGVTLKTLIAATGYGGDLLASKSAVAAGQGMDFMTTTVPVEAKTPATQKMAADLAAVGVTSSPSWSEMEGYLLIKLLETGLKGAGANPTPQSLQQSLDKVKNYDADGLLPSKYDLRDYTPTTSCTYIVRLEGDAFKVQPGMPMCGQEFKLSS